MAEFEENLIDGAITSAEFLESSILRFHRYVDELRISDDEEEDDQEIAGAEEEADADEAPQPEADQEHVGERINNICPVCLAAPRSAVVTPCGHSACYSCADTIFQMAPPANKCQEYRQPIMSVVRVFGMS